MISIDVRKFLYSCRGAVFEIRSLERQRESIRIPMGPRAGSKSIVDLTSKDNDPTATALNEYDYYDDLLRDKIEGQKQKLAQFEGMLSTIQDESERTVMRYYFAQGWTYSRIAFEMGDIDEKTIKRKRWSATQFLERKFSV